jgi:hypothetical protein
MEKTLLILTTLPHAFVCIYSPTTLYSLTVLSTTALSALWHANQESISLAVADHAVTGVWFLLDCYYSWNMRQHKFTQILALNLLTASLSLLANPNKPYRHSAWHLFSVIKSIYVVQLLS